MLKRINLLIQFIFSKLFLLKFSKLSNAIYLKTYINLFYLILNNLKVKSVVEQTNNKFI